MNIEVANVIGAGGHGRVVADALRRSGLNPGVIVMRDARPGRTPTGLVIASPEIVESMHAQHFHVAIGSAGARESLHAAAMAIGARPLTIIHPAGTVSPDATLGAAVLVGAGAVVAPDAAVGEATIVNHNSVVDHDCDIGGFCHIAPGAILGGGVTLGDRVLIGARAVILPGVTIVSDVVVGAGAVVLHSIDEPGTWVGNPARKLFER